MGEQFLWATQTLVPGPQGFQRPMATTARAPGKVPWHLGSYSLGSPSVPLGLISQQHKGREPEARPSNSWQTNFKIYFKSCIRISATLFLWRVLSFKQKFFKSNKVISILISSLPECRALQPPGRANPF